MLTGQTVTHSRQKSVCCADRAEVEKMQGLIDLLTDERQKNVAQIREMQERILHLTDKLRRFQAA